MKLALPLCVLAIVALFSSPASAQTHPCDEPTSSVQTIAAGAPHAVTLCEDQAANIEAVIVWIDGQAVDLQPIAAKSAANAAGLVLYETTQRFVQVAKGLHVVEAAAYNRNKLTGNLQVGAKSDPFSFAADDPTPVPAAPVIKGITR
jgi:hypothetical protein